MRIPKPNDLRPDRQARVMIELELASLWATCQRGKVASAIITMEWQVIISARNGTPRNQPHCAELTNPVSRCQFCIHSETNLINRAARRGIATEGLQIATLKRPCLGCANNIVEAGIAAVYYREDYDTDGQRNYVFNMFEKQNIFCRQLEMTLHEKEFSYMAGIWYDGWPEYKDQGNRIHYMDTGQLRSGTPDI